MQRAVMDTYILERIWLHTQCLRLCEEREKVVVVVVVAAI
jgi:hypothetical protein